MNDSASSLRLADLADDWHGDHRYRQIETRATIACVHVDPAAADVASRDRADLIEMIDAHLADLADLAEEINADAREPGSPGVGDPPADMPLTIEVSR